MKIGNISGSKCLFYYFKVCGLAPINLNIEISRDTNDQQYYYKFVDSLSSVLYNVSLTIGLIISNFIAIYNYFYEVDRQNEFIYHMTNICGVLGATYIIIVFCLKRNKQISAWNEISEKMNIDISEETTKFAKIKLAIFVYAFNWFGSTISVISLHDFGYATFLLSMNVCHLVITSVALQYCIIVEIIGHLFTKLNKNLKNLKKIHGNDVIIANELSRLWLLHVDLARISLKVSSFYSMSVIPIIVNGLLIPTTIVYATIAKPIILIGNFNLIVNDYVSGILFTLTYLCSIAMLTSSVTATIDQVQENYNFVFVEIFFEL